MKDDKTSKDIDDKTLDKEIFGSLVDICAEQKNHSNWFHFGFIEKYRITGPESPMIAMNTPRPT